MAEDRDFALLLHNQDFLDQMQSNQEFMRTLNQDERAGLSAHTAGLLSSYLKCVSITCLLEGIWAVIIEISELGLLIEGI